MRVSGYLGVAFTAIVAAAVGYGSSAIVGSAESDPRTSKASAHQKSTVADVNRIPPEFDGAEGATSTLHPQTRPPKLPEPTAQEPTARTRPPMFR